MKLIQTWAYIGKTCLRWYKCEIIKAAFTRMHAINSTWTSETKLKTYIPGLFCSVGWRGGMYAGYSHTNEARSSSFRCALCCVLLLMVYLQTEAALQIDCN